MNLISYGNEHRLCTKLMGCAFELIIVHEDAENAEILLQSGVSEIQRIEVLLSEFIPSSLTSQINKNAGIKAVEVPKEVFGLLQRCQQISKLTKGAFDITVSPLKQIYSFKKEGFEMPDTELINATLERVGHEKLLLDEVNRTAFLTEPGMRISFAAIGKGYAADQVKKLWLGMGPLSGVINASGDLASIGRRADGSPWQLGIPHPNNKQSIQFQLPMENTSVATSGDYEQYFTHNGIRYSHTIHPKTGYPVTGIKSVSVFSPGAELSDALATAVFVMGVEAGLHFINQLPKTHCIVVDGGDGVHFSKELELEKRGKLGKRGKLEKRRHRYSVPLQMLIAVLILSGLNSCASVAPYERIYLNDPEMQMGNSSADFFENYVLSIREGAMPPGSAKTSGGCGCN